MPRSAALVAVRSISFNVFGVRGAVHPTLPTSSVLLIIGGRYRPQTMANEVLS
jgi:hypothetical protein